MLLGTQISLSIHLAATTTLGGESEVPVDGYTLGGQPITLGGEILTESSE
jgi:hypothetical protein